MTKILIDMPSHDELATKRFLQRNAPISKQVLSLFLFPMTYLSGPFDVEDDSILEKNLQCSLFSQCLFNQRPIDVANLDGFVKVT